MHLLQLDHLAEVPTHDAANCSNELLQPAPNWPAVVVAWMQLRLQENLTTFVLPKLRFICKAALQVQLSLLAGRLLLVRGSNHMRALHCS